MEIKKAKILDVQDSTRALFRTSFPLELSNLVGKICEITPASLFESFYHIVGEPKGFYIHESWLDFDFNKKQELPVSTTPQINSGRSYYTCNCGRIKEFNFRVLCLQEYGFCHTCKRNTLWIKTPNATPYSSKGVSGHPGIAPDKIKEIWPNHCVTGDTLIETKHGPVPIKQLVEKPGPEFIREIGSNTVINVSEELAQIDSYHLHNLRYNLLTGDADKEFSFKCAEVVKSTLSGEEHQIGNIKGLDKGFRTFLERILKETGGRLHPELYHGHPLIPMPWWENKSSISTPCLTEEEAKQLRGIKGVKYLRCAKTREWGEFPQAINTRDLYDCIRSNIPYDIVILRISQHFFAVLKPERVLI